MFDKILVPTDGSELAEKAVDHAIEFCRSTGASMTAVYVRSPTPIREVVSLSDYGPGSKEAITLEEIMARMEAHGRELLDAVARRARSQGVECTTVIAEDDEPYRRHHRCGRTTGLQHDLHGLSWPRRQSERCCSGA